MIEIKLHDMMWQRRIRSVSELSRRAGVSRQTVDALYNRPKKIKGIQFETLERLCRALDCGVEDLIHYVPDAVSDMQPKIEAVHEGDPDYRVFEDMADEPVVALEACDELFERLDQIRRQREHPD